MAIDKNTVQNLMNLSKINCSDEEKENLLKDLKVILDYIELLKQIDTDNVPPCNHVLEDVVNVTRKDIVENDFAREDFLKNAPSQTGGLIRVPPVQ